MSPFEAGVVFWESQPFVHVPQGSLRYTPNASPGEESDQHRKRICPAHLLSSGLTLRFHTFPSYDLARIVIGNTDVLNVTNVIYMLPYISILVQHLLEVAGSVLLGNYMRDGTFSRSCSIWATAFIYDEDDNMWRQAGFVEMLVSPAKRGQNEMGGLQKRGRFKTF